MSKQFPEDQEFVNDKGEHFAVVRNNQWQWFAISSQGSYLCDSWQELTPGWQDRTRTFRWSEDVLSAVYGNKQKMIALLLLAEPTCQELLAEPTCQEV